MIGGDCDKVAVICSSRQNITNGRSENVEPSVRNVPLIGQINQDKALRVMFTYRFAFLLPSLPSLTSLRCFNFSLDVSLALDIHSRHSAQAITDLEAQTVLESHLLTILEIINNLFFESPVDCSGSYCPPRLLSRQSAENSHH